MDLTLNNKIINDTHTNNEIENFITGLKKSLDMPKINTVNDIITNEVCKEMELALKHKNKLDNIINKAFDIESYNYEFFCLNYDNTNDSYFLNHYYDGEIDKIEMTDQEIKEFQNTGGKVGQFYKLYDENHLVEADYVKDSIKINVNSLLNELELKNK